jgi:hypothetical protein
METRQTRLNDSANQEAFVVGIRAYKGKKDVFNDDIVIDKIDAMKLNEFIKVKF